MPIGARWRARAGTPTFVQFVHIPYIKLTPRRRRPRRKALAFPPLIAAAEMLLVALIAASRR
jgi:hypothetical protein